MATNALATTARFFSDGKGKSVRELKTLPERNNNKKKRRGRGRKKLKGNNKVKLFSIIGNNINGLKAKIDSLQSVVNIFSPSVICLQETKLRSKGIWKAKGFRTFERLRKGFGGGLLTAIDEDLSPVLLSEGEGDLEILVVQLTVGGRNMRIINCYGPQEDQALEVVFNFWQKVEKEILDSKRGNCSIILETDANAKIGSSIIKGDPHEMSRNGKLFLEMIKRQGLIVLNAESKGVGIVTRQNSWW